MVELNKHERRAADVKIAKMSTSLYTEFAKIAHIRFINGKDKKCSPPKVQKKALRHPLWPQIRKDLEIANFVEDD